MKDADDFLQPGGAFRTTLVSRMLADLPLDAPVYPAGSRIGPFRIVAVIGRGGASVVYRAERHDGGFDQTVALKVANGGQRWREMFERERNLLARLSHPVIVPILDGGETEDGRLWLAMPLVDGERIDRWCERHAATWMHRLRLLVSVCEAVHSAHLRRVVHRDLKPSNILVDAEGSPRVLDFGISGLIGSRDPDGFLALTPEFSSPEQQSGGEITAATDVYLLGQVCSALLARQPMPRLAQRNLDAVIARATQLDPMARYGSVGELARDLSGVSRNLPARGGVWSLPWRCVYALRRRWLVLLVGLVGVAVIGAISVDAVVEIAAERDRAVRQERATLELSRFTSLLYLQALNTSAIDRDGTYEALKARQRKLMEDTRGDPNVRSALLLALGRAYNEIGRLDESIAVLRQATALSGPLGESHRVELAQQFCELAWAYHFHGDSAVAAESIGASRRVLSASSDSESPRRLAAVQCLGRTSIEFGQFRDAHLFVQEALRLSERLYGSSSEDHIVALGTSAELARREYQPGVALAATELVVADVTRRLGPEHAKTLAEAIRLQSFVAANGDPAAATQQLRQLVAAADRPGLEYRYPRHAAAFYLGESLRYQGHYAESAPWFERALSELDEPDAVLQRPHLMADTAHVAEFEWARGDLDMAETHLRIVVAASARAVPVGHDLAYYRMVLGALLAARGSALDEAEGLLHQSLAQLMASYGGNSYPVARAHLALAQVAARRQRVADVTAELALMQWSGARTLPNEYAVLMADRNDLLAAQADDATVATRLTRESVTMLDSALGATHPRTAQARVTLAEYLRESDADQARQLLAQAQPAIDAEMARAAPVKARLRALRAALN